MLDPEDKVLVAVSGGPDSIALLHLLRMLAPEKRLRLGVIHLNHGLRGAASDSEADFVRSVATALRLPFFVEKADVNAFRKTHRLSLEEAARQVRYDYFHKAAAAHQYDKVALGHHSDDNAELVLMNILRGSGPQGLSGIPPVRVSRFIRPLIDLNREDLKHFLAENDIPFILDASNEDRRHRRNQIRHELIPLIRRNYNPDIMQSLSRLAAIMRDENHWIDGLAEKVFSECILDRERDCLILSVDRLTALEPPLLRRVLRKTLFEIKRDLRRIRFSHIDAIGDLLLGGPNEVPVKKEIHLPNRIRVQRSGLRLILRMTPKTSGKTETPSDPAFCHFNYQIAEQNIDSTLDLPEINARMRFSVLTESSLPNLPFSPTSAYFDLDALIFPLVVRPPQPGDRFKPLGLGGAQKLKAFFINQKVPMIQRRRCPLLLSGDAIIWIAGHRTAEIGKVSDKTQNILKVELSLA